MAIATLRQQLGLQTPQVKVLEGHAPDYLAAAQSASADLVKSIKDGTVTAAQVDSFLQDKLGLLPSSKQQRAHEFLLSKKAWLVSQEGKLEEALQLYDEALKIKETPSTWALKGTALLQLDRPDDAFDAFRKSYSLRQEFGPQQQAYLEDLLGGWSVAALLRCLSGILEQDAREAEKGAFEYIALLTQAKEDGLEQMVLNLAVEQPVADDVKAALEELELMARLLPIKDPFEG
jgi:tetratricopeptide (TPR) repeat protein